MDDLSRILNSAALETLQKHAPGLADAILNLKQLGVSDDKILARCRAAGASGIVAALIEAAVAQDGN